MAPGLNALLAAAQGWRRSFSWLVLALGPGSLVLAPPLPANALPVSASPTSGQGAVVPATANQGPGRPTIPTGLVSIESDIQRADQATGVITATGNVRILYPDKGVMATARQAQYFSREGRVVLSGDVDVVQQDGNRLRAEQVVYLVGAQRVTALPATNQQVLSRLRLITSARPASPAPATANPGAGAAANRPVSPAVAP